LWQTSAQSIWSGQSARSPRRAGPTRSLATGCAQRAALEEVADLLSKVFSDTAFFESQNLCFDKHRPLYVFFHPAAPPWEIKILYPHRKGAGGRPHLSQQGPGFKPCRTVLSEMVISESMSEQSMRQKRWPVRWAEAAAS